MDAHLFRFTALAVTLSATLAFGESSTLAKLGMPQDSRVVIIHADDVGMSWSAHIASIEAMEKGSVSTGSAMVPCSWFPATVKACKKNPKLDMGLHLTLTSEWNVYRWGPVAGRNLVPKLVDDEGYLWRDVLPVYTSVGGHLEQVETEVQAQIDFSRKLGLEATHIDSHMGTLYYREDFFKTTCNLAAKNSLPFMTFAYREGIDSLLPYYTKEISEKLEAAGFPLIDQLIKEEQVGETFDAGFKNYCDVISTLQPGVTLIIVHLGADGDELENITSSNKRRDQQYRIFTDPRMAEHLKKEKVTLIGWRELKEKIWDKRDKTIQKVF